MSPVQLVIDNEMIDYIRRYRRGADRAGRAGVRTHTAKVRSPAAIWRPTTLQSHFRNELYAPVLLKPARPVKRHPTLYPAARTSAPQRLCNRRAR